MGKTITIGKSDKLSIHANRRRRRAWDWRQPVSTTNWGPTSTDSDDRKTHLNGRLRHVGDPRHLEGAMSCASIVNGDGNEWVSLSTKHNDDRPTDDNRRQREARDRRKLNTETIGDTCQPSELEMTTNGGFMPQKTDSNVFSSAYARMRSVTVNRFERLKILSCL